jgi:dCMP deaminase
MIRAEKRRERAIQHLRDSAALRLARDNHASSVPDVRAQVRKLGIGKLMEDQVPENYVVPGIGVEGAKIFLVPRAIGGPRFRSRPQIKPRNRDSVSGNSQADLAGASADFERNFAGAEQGRQGSLEPAMVTENQISKPKVPAIVQRIRMVVGQGIEQLGLKRALHAGLKLRSDDAENVRHDRRRLPDLVIVSRVRRTFMSLTAPFRNLPDTPAIPSVPVLPVDLIAEAAGNFPHRPSWDEYFMATAVLIATRSNCERLHVGCVIVTGGARKNRIVTAGYNGFLPATPHVSRVRDGHEQATVHAEQNAVADAARRGSSVEGCVAYVTHYPCINCAKILAAAGIAEIKYRADYLNDPLVAPLLVDAGVKVLKL